MSKIKSERCSVCLRKRLLVKQHCPKCQTHHVCLECFKAGDCCYSARKMHDHFDTVDPLR